MTRQILRFGVVMLAVSFAVCPSIMADRITKKSGRIIQPNISRSGIPSPVVTALRIHPNGQWMVSAGDDHAVRIWDIESGRQLKQFSGHRDWVDAAAFSPDGNLLVTAGNDHRIFLWDLSTDNRTSVRSAADAPIAALAFSNSGRQFAIVGFDRAVSIYDVHRRQLERNLRAPCRDMRCVAFSNDDKLLACGGRNGRIGVFDVGAGKRLRIFDAHSQRIRAITFSDDDKRIITAGEDRVIRSWDASSFDCVSEISTEKSKPMAMVSLGNGQLATGGSDNCISIWNLADGKRLQILRGHTGSVVALDHKNGLLISGSFDTTVRVWPIGNEDEVVTRGIRRTR